MDLNFFHKKDYTKNVINALLKKICVYLEYKEQD